MERAKKNWYYTFGTASYSPYKGGYLIVRAVTLKDANGLFEKKYPCMVDGVLNCAFYYSQEAWERGVSNYFVGVGPHEVIE